MVSIWGPWALADGRVWGTLIRDDRVRVLFNLHCRIHARVRHHHRRNRAWFDESWLLSLSANRFEIVVGKWLGLGAVLCFTIFVGYGIAGLLIALNVSNVDVLEYLAFIGLTMLFGLVFLTVALCFSTVFAKRSTALGGAIFLWFLFNIILPIVFVGLLATTIDFTQITMQSTITAPDWYSCSTYVTRSRCTRR